MLRLTQKECGEFADAFMSMGTWWGGGGHNYYETEALGYGAYDTGVFISCNEYSDEWFEKDFL